MYIHISVSRLRSPYAPRTPQVVLPPAHTLCPFHKGQQGESLGWGHPAASAPTVLSGLTEFGLPPPGYMNHSAMNL